MNMSKASEKLSKLDLQISIDNFVINILWFRVMSLEGEWEISRHTHSSFEFHFVPVGSSLVILDDHEFIIREGEFYVTAPGLYHEQRSAGERYIEYSINCDFEKADDSVFFEGDVILEVLNSSKCGPVKDHYGSMKYFELALKEAYHQEIGFYNNIKSLAIMIIIMAVRAIVFENSTSYFYSVPKKLEETDYRFNLIKKFIEDNITSDLRVNDIANYMHLSSKQINRIIKEKTGKSTKEFINFIKLQEAKRLLKNTNISIKEIANSLGFSSEYYFNQFFKREEGFPPGIYRNSIKKIY
ncbi:transcriptional regulator, AraC family [Thermoanaerobacter mathranii subsp. mathranii str. A3]|uniref:Transcriptional regulator, AraC family n=2 Tax=Thermoanaerobacter TaxID=1754 RepID=D3T408_THEIA|nr:MULTISPECIES: AraC family transcriptional regulator [Thermoanaerobacter]ADD02960.1 transcriptional regulator, AraC family [Thermoanaerobacter italicus Ab9]ADH61408.1 transcriptional regulator, AraC family [Thermoanaerobacter mathranii subsp. mathranii str. A3]